MKGSREAILTAAWRTANFTRADKLKDLDVYLNPKPVKFDQKREQGVLDVRRMFERLAAKNTPELP